MTPAIKPANGVDGARMRVAIARACGWTGIHMHAWTGDCEVPVGIRQGGIHRSDLPDYCNDLNAMHAAEASCIFNTKASLGMCYAEQLNKVAPKTAPIHATALQRAEAFCRTLSLTLTD